MSGYFTAANRIGTLAAVEVGEQFFSVTATLLLLSLWAGSDPARACQAVVIGGGISGCITLCALVILRLWDRQKAASRIPVRKRLLSCAVPLAGADIVKAGISTTENLLVPKRLSLYPDTADPLAAFGMICGMVFPVLMFPAAILFGLAELLIPELARCSAAGSSVRIRYLVRRSLRVTMLYGCLFCGLMFLLSDKLCLRLYGSTDAGIWLRRFSLMIPMLYCDAITDAMTKGLGQQKACVRYNILTSAMDVAFLYLLLPRYGIGGYYFSFLVTHALNFALSLRRLVKISGIRIRIRTPLLAAGVTGISILGVSFLQNAVFGSLCYVIVSICLLFLCRVLDREDLRWLGGLVGKK